MFFLPSEPLNLWLSRPVTFISDGLRERKLTAEFHLSNCTNKLLRAFASNPVGHYLGWMNEWMNESSSTRSSQSLLDLLWRSRSSATSACALWGNSDEDLCLWMQAEGGTRAACWWMWSTSRVLLQGSGLVMINHRLLPMLHTASWPYNTVNLQ